MGLCRTCVLGHGQGPPVRSSTFVLEALVSFSSMPREHPKRGNAGICTFHCHPQCPELLSTWLLIVPTWICPCAQLHPPLPSHRRGWRPPRQAHSLPSHYRGPAPSRCCPLGARLLPCGPGLWPHLPIISESGPEFPGHYGQGYRAPQRSKHRLRPHTGQEDQIQFSRQISSCW